MAGKVLVIPKRSPSLLESPPAFLGPSGSRRCHCNVAGGAFLSLGWGGGCPFGLATWLVVAFASPDMAGLAWAGLEVVIRERAPELQEHRNLFLC